MVPTVPATTAAPPAIRWTGTLRRVADRGSRRCGSAPAARTSVSSGFRDSCSSAPGKTEAAVAAGKRRAGYRSTTRTVTDRRRMALSRVPWPRSPGWVGHLSRLSVAALQNRACPFRVTRLLRNSWFAFLPPLWATFSSSPLGCGHTTEATVVSRFPIVAMSMQELMVRVHI